MNNNRCVEDPKRLKTKLLEVINEFNKVLEYNANIHKTFLFLCTRKN